MLTAPNEFIVCFCSSGSQVVADKSAGVTDEPLMNGFVNVKNNQDVEMEENSRFLAYLIILNRIEISIRPNDRNNTHAVFH